MIYEIANAWIDENMNSWDKERFTREDAEYESKYMDSCYHCHNCRRCTKCSWCKECTDCKSCSWSEQLDVCADCRHASNCKRCVGCSYLANSTNCADCYHSAWLDYERGVWYTDKHSPRQQPEQERPELLKLEIKQGAN